MGSPVRFHIGDNSEVHESSFLCQDAAEAAMAVMRLNADGTQIIDIIEEDGTSLRPTFPDFDHFERGRDRFLRCRTVNGEQVRVEEPPAAQELPPDAAAKRKS